MNTDKLLYVSREGWYTSEQYILYTYVGKNFAELLLIPAIFLDLDVHIL